MRIPTQQEKKGSGFTQGVMLKQRDVGCLKSPAGLFQIKISIKNKMIWIWYTMQQVEVVCKVRSWVLCFAFCLSTCVFVTRETMYKKYITGYVQCFWLNACVSADKWKLTYSLCFVSVHSGLHLPDLLPIWKQRECSVQPQQWKFKAVVWYFGECTCFFLLFCWNWCYLYVCTRNTKLQTTAS